MDRSDAEKLTKDVINIFEEALPEIIDKTIKNYQNSIKELEEIIDAKHKIIEDLDEDLDHSASEINGLLLEKKELEENCIGFEKEISDLIEDKNNLAEELLSSNQEINSLLNIGLKSQDDELKLTIRTQGKLIDEQIAEIQKLRDQVKHFKDHPNWKILEELNIKSNTIKDHIEGMIKIMNEKNMSKELDLILNLVSHNDLIDKLK